MARVRIDPSLARAITRNAPKIDAFARQHYGISGKKLLARVAAGEAGGKGVGRAGVSSAGARGPMQFIKSTRDAYLAKYGIDAWRSNDEAVKAAIIHIKGTGLAGYNPGDPGYTDYILGQRTTGVSGAGRGMKGGEGGLAGVAAKRITVNQPGRTVVDTDSALVDSLMAGAAGRRHGGLLQDATRRIDSGGYTTRIPGTKLSLKGPKSSTRKAAVKGLQVVHDANHGAKALAEYATRGIYGSGERTPAQNAAAGGAPGSDHLTTNRWASAVDAKYGTGKLIAKRLGIKGWKKGTYDRHIIKVDGRKYSVQILEDVEGHYDHTHVGIQRVR
jgi:hypothetical protein